MTHDHDAFDALRAADRPRPLTDEARRRVEDRMLVAYEEARAEGRSRPADASGTMIDLGGGRADRGQHHKGRRVLLAAAAAAVILAVALAAAVTLGEPDDRVDVAGTDGTGMDPEVVLAVRTWCRADLGDLRADVEALDGDATDTQRRVALNTLATAADGLFEVLSDLQIADGARRLQELGRLSGEAAVLRDGGPPITAGDVADLVTRLEAELVLLSGAGAACELAP